MNLTLNKLLTFVLLALVFVNITIFVKGITLSDEINYYEKEMKTLKQQNTDYEYKIYALESISKTASLAAQLEYGVYNDPIYVDQPQYAYNN